MEDTTVKIHNIETGEIIERQMNAEELAQREEENLKNANRLVIEEKVAGKKAALLAKLGITADEATLLLS